MKKALQQRGFDQLDKAILDELQHNGRTSVADLARKIHLSQPAVHNRIKRLEREGVIRSYVALLDSELVGYQLMSFVNIRLNPNTQDIIDFIHARVCEWSMVLECYRVAGRSDLLLKLLVENRHQLNDLISRVMQLEGVEHIETTVVLEPLKQTTMIELD